MIIVKYEIVCCACGDSVIHKYRMRHGETPMWPLIPSDWNVINGNLYCANHKLKITKGPRRPANARDARLE